MTYNVAAARRRLSHRDADDRGTDVTVTRSGMCNYAVAPTSQGVGSRRHPFGGGDHDQRLRVDRREQRHNWMTVTGGSSGTGNGTVSYAVAANTGTSRPGTLTIAGQTLNVTQAGVCNFTVAPTSQNVARSRRHPVSDGDHDQRMRVDRREQQHQLDDRHRRKQRDRQRHRDLLGGRQHVDQLAPRIADDRQDKQLKHHTNQAYYNFTVARPTSQNVAAAGGTQSATVTTTGGCAWTAVSNNTGWMTVTGGSSGTGNGTVTYSVAANTGTARTGTLTIAGQTVTVTQAGSCNYTVAPTTQSAVTAGGSHSAAVTTTSGCGWTGVSKSTSWISITSGSSGAGNGAVSYTVAANMSASSRTGTLTIAGRTVTITQVAATVAPSRPTGVTVIK